MGDVGLSSILYGDAILIAHVHVKIASPYRIEDKPASPIYPRRSSQSVGTLIRFWEMASFNIILNFLK